MRDVGADRGPLGRGQDGLDGRPDDHGEGRREPSLLGVKPRRVLSEHDPNAE